MTDASALQAARDAAIGEMQEAARRMADVFELVNLHGGCLSRRKLDVVLELLRQSSIFRTNILDEYIDAHRDDDTQSEAENPVFIAHGSHARVIAAAMTRRDELEGDLDAYHTDGWDQRLRNLVDTVVSELRAFANDPQAGTSTANGHDTR